MLLQQQLSLTFPLQRRRRRRRRRRYYVVVIIIRNNVHLKQYKTTVVNHGARQIHRVKYPAPTVPRPIV